jgi:hypothetical protein
MSETPPTTAQKLTVKERIFIVEYVRNGGNGRAAADFAGLDPASGSSVAARPKVRAAVTEALRARAMTSTDVVAGIERHAGASIEDFIDVDPLSGTWRFNMAKAKSSGCLALIKKIKTTAEGGTEIELHDSQSALEKLAKIHGLFTDRTLIQHDITLTARVDATRRALTDATRTPEEHLALIELAERVAGALAGKVTATRAAGATGGPPALGAGVVAPVEVEGEIVDD